MEIESKVAIVTGGAVRIGRAISLGLARQGCHLLIHYASSSGSAEEIRDLARAEGVKAEIYQANLQEAASAGEVIAAGYSFFGRTDILINNAAVFLEGGLLETTLEMWDRQFAINLRAPFLLSQAFARLLEDGDRGAIININDARIFRPAPDHFAYRMTKSALLALTETLALDLAPSITVNAVALGAILPPHDRGDLYLQNLAQKKIPLRMPGEPEMVSDGVLYLLGQDFLTGVTIKIDGGEFL